MDIKNQIKSSLENAYKNAISKNADVSFEMSNQLKNDISKIKDLSEDEDILKMFEQMTNDMLDSEEENDDEIKDDEIFDFYHTTYEPETKSIVGAYYIVDDLPKQIVILNNQEYINEDTFYGDGAEPIKLAIKTVKLPKSQIEILDSVEGMENFFFIRMPYWLFKKNGNDLQIVRVNDSKRIYNFYVFNDHKYKNDILDIVNQTYDDEITLNRFKSNIEGSTKQEPKEATGAASAGGYAAPLFGKPQKRKIKEEKLEGGMADNMSLEDMAKYHDTDIEVILDKLEDGVNVEMEHTSKMMVAFEIAMDHIYEDLNYYDKLEKIEGKPHKEESKEATTSASVGVYDAPIGGGRKDPLEIDTPKGVYSKLRSVKDKNFPKYGGKDGKYVKVKDKCKKFPYCNQGDINALEFFEKKEVREAILNVSKITKKKPNDIILEIIKKLEK